MQTISWIENSPKRGWRVVISSMKSSWRPVNSGVLQKSILDPVLSSSDLDEGVKCNLSSFADDTKPGVVADTPNCCAAIQRNLVRMQKLADRNIIKFNKNLNVRRNTLCTSIYWGLLNWKAALHISSCGF